MRSTKTLAEMFAVVVAPVASAYRDETGRTLDVAAVVRSVGKVAGRLLRKLANHIDPEVKPEPVAEVEQKQVEQPAAVPAGWGAVDTSVPVEEPVPMPRGWASLDDVRFPSELAPTASVVAPAKPAGKPRKPAAKKPAARKAAPKKTASHVAKLQAERKPRRKPTAK